MGRGYQADRSLWTGAWVWENPDRTYHRASVAACLSCSKAVRKENQKRKSRKREGAGISACSFPACRDGYKCLYVFVKWHF